MAIDKYEVVKNFNRLTKLFLIYRKGKRENSVYHRKATICLDISTGKTEIL